MKESRLEKILEATKSKPFIEKIQKKIPDIVSKILENNENTDLADQGLIFSLKELSNYRRIKKIKEVLNKEYEFLSYIQKNSRILIKQLKLFDRLEDEITLGQMRLFEEKNEHFGNQKNILKSISYFLENNGLMKQDAFFNKVEEYRGIIADFTNFSEKTITNIANIDSVFKGKNKKEKIELIDKYKRNINLFEDIETIKVLDQFLYDFLVKSNSKLDISEERSKFEKISKFFEKNEEIGKQIKNVDRGIKVPFLYSMNYYSKFFQKEKNYYPLDIKSISKAVKKYNYRLININKSAHYAFFMSFLFNMKYRCDLYDIFPKTAEKYRNGSKIKKIKEYKQEKFEINIKKVRHLEDSKREISPEIEKRTENFLNIFIDIIEPFSSFLYKWDFINKDINEIQEKKIIDIYIQNLKNRKIESRKIFDSKIEYKEEEEFKKNFFDIYKKRFINSLIFCYLNVPHQDRYNEFESEKGLEEMISSLDNIKDDLLSCCFLNQTFKYWSLKDDVNKIHLKLKIFNKLLKKEIPDKDRFKICDSLEKTDMEEEFNKNVYYLLEEGIKDSDEIIECASITHPDFRIKRKLGSGTFGNTYLMENLGEGKKLHALKIKREGEFPDTKGIEAKLKHKNIAEMYGILKCKKINKGRSFIRQEFQLNDAKPWSIEEVKAIDMEYVAGDNLKEYLQKNKLEPKKALWFGLEILEGLEYLGYNGIMHRDLKPQNIMIDKNKNLKLIDFGLSRSLDDKEKPKMNRLYSAPEFKTGKEYLNSDIWSFGLILYEMLSGEYFFKTEKKWTTPDEEKDYVSSIERKWLESKEEIDLDYIFRINNKIPRDLGKIIFKCLTVNPFNRYGAIKEVKEDLSKVYRKYEFLEMKKGEELKKKYSDVFKRINSMTEKERKQLKGMI